MKSYVAKSIGYVLAAGVALAAAPASAATWQCTAKNERGASYTRSAVGVVSAIVKARASDKALAACASDSLAPRSCVIVNCTRP